MKGILPKVLGLAFGGFEDKEILEKLNFYSTTAWEIGLIILGLFFVYYDRRDDKEYGNFTGIASYGESPSPSFIKNIRGGHWNIFWLSVIIMSILTLFLVNVSQSSFVGTIKQQFTPVSKLIYNITLVPAMENLGFIAVGLWTFIILGIIARKRQWTKNNFNIYSILFYLITTTIYWVVNHLWRYGTTDVGLGYVLVFALMMGVLTLISGSAYPAWFLHIFNNAFISLKEMFNSDSITNWGIGIIIILTIFYIYWFYIKSRKKKDPYPLS